MKNLKDPKKLWNSTKNELFGNNRRNINRMMDGNKLINGSEKVANVLNRYFIRKPINIVNKLPPLSN